MKVVFFGLGSIGERHAKIIQKYYAHELYAYRSSHKGKNIKGVTNLYRWIDLDCIAPDVAFICNPTHKHIQTAIKCAKRKMHLFIEKPIDSQLKDLPALLDLVKKNHLSTYVAYVLRFHPVIREVKKYMAKYQPLHARIQTTSYLFRWRKNRKPHATYSSFTRQGGGVIYDLSHELDYAEDLFGGIRRVEGRYGRRGRVTVDSEDYADMLVQTQNVPVNIHVNYLSQIYQREIRIDFEDRSIVGDFMKSTLVEYRDRKLVRKLKFSENTKKCYEHQIKYFFKNINNARMINNLYDAVPLFKKIYAFKRKVKLNG